MVYGRTQSLKVRLRDFFKGENTADCEQSIDRSLGGLWRNSRNDQTRTAREPRSKQRWNFGFRFSERGFSTLGGCLTLVSSIAGIGLCSIGIRIHQMSLYQVQLDRYTGSYVLNLRAASITMENSYDRMEAYRIATLAACATITACPEALELFKTAATAEAGIETAAKTYWDLQKVSWNTLNLEKSEFPDFPFEIVNPELSLTDLGSARFELKKSKTIELTLNKRNLKSTAELNRKHAHVWNVAWTE